MDTTERQPVAPSANHCRSGHGLRMLLVFAGVTVAFFSLAHARGYVDAAIALLAFVLLVCVLRYARPVRPATGVLVTLVAGTLLWANLRPTGWEEELNEIPPDELDAVTRAMFYRGWPLCPCMLCPIHGMRFRPERGFVQAALLIDGFVFAMALFTVRIACELCFRGRDKRVIEKPSTTKYE